MIVDDIVDTAGTLTEAARALQGRGRAPSSAPRSPTPCSRARRSSASRSRRSSELVVTDTIPLRPEPRDCGKLQVVSASPRCVGEAIRRINNEESVSSLFV